MAEQQESAQSTDQVGRISAALEAGRLQAVKRTLHALHPGEIALLLESLRLRERKILWRVVDDEDRGEVLLHLPEEVRDGLIREMDAADIIAAAEGLDIDDLADFLEDLPETLTQQVLRAMDTGDRQRLEAVLAYEPDTAGGLMNTDTVTVRPDVNLEVVQRYLRLRGELPENTDCLYVVNRYGHYLGSLPLDKILTLDPETLVTEAMDREREALPVHLSDKDVSHRFENQDLVSAPVVATDNVLVGRITVDDVVDVIRAEAEHSLLGMAGLTEEEDLFAPLTRSTRRRAVWLGINLVTAFIASSVVGLFEASIVQVVALAVLMPIVASMGGIGGSQTLTLMTRGLALGQISRSNTRFLLIKEVAIGFINGLLWALVVALITLAWFHSIQLALVIGLAMVFNQLNGALTGVWLPLLLKRMGIDPAIAGSVILTTFTDVGGFFALLGLGTLFLLK